MDGEPLPEETELIDRVAEQNARIIGVYFKKEDRGFRARLFAVAKHYNQTESAYLVYFIKKYLPQEEKWMHSVEQVADEPRG